MGETGNKCCVICVPENNELDHYDNIITNKTINKKIKVRKQNGNNSGVICNSVFYCKKCDHTFIRKYDYERHLMGRKHNGQKYEKSEENTKQYDNCCKKCSKEYKTRGGLWKHNKICIVEENKLELDEVKEIFSSMMKTNADFQKLMLESNHAIMDSHKKLIEHTNNTIVNNTIYNTSNTSNTNNTNTINNKFNLNFFLNETCKDAMNIMDFVEMVKSELKLKDFEAYENGYSNTVSGLFLRGLEGLEVNQRPIHCSDLKREVIYVKDDNVWHLDSKQKLVTKAVKYISHYNFKQYSAWQKEHPECEDTNSKVHEYYMKLVRNCMSGGTDEEIENNYKKIIRNVMKEVVIDKKKFIK